MIVIFTHDVLIYLLMLSISLISYDTAQKASPEIPFRSYRRTCMGLFLSSGRFGLLPFFVRIGKAVFRPVASDQVRGARGRGQGTETLAKA